MDLSKTFSLLSLSLKRSEEIYLKSKKERKKKEKVRKLDKSCMKSIGFQIVFRGKKG
jgi:hypothetical protein